MEFDVTIEIPKGQRNKYEMDHHSGTSLYFTGPDGERLELIKDPLGEMYGDVVL